jgi:ADP-ribosylglycohydrolase
MTTPKEPPLAPSSTGERLACESLVGLSVGDALGARFEGARFDHARLHDTLEPHRLARWTDDTQMALSIAEVLLAHGTIDQDRLARAFGRRYEPWRGYSSNTQALLQRIHQGKDWRALADELLPGGSFGNGSAMRVAPLGAYFHEATVDVVVTEAERSAEVTHSHPEGRAGGAATALAAWLAARSRGRPVPPVNELFSVVRGPLDPSLRVTRGIEAASRLSPETDLEDAAKRLGNGSNVTCFDTVPLALWIAFCNLDDFERAVRSAVACGGDADTLAAIVGGIVAARLGSDAIPSQWRSVVEPVDIRF